jgi:hypothetical protein
MDIELELAEPVLDIHFENRAHAGGCCAVPKTATRRRNKNASV